MKMRNYAWLTAILLIAGLLGWTASGMAGIANTKHNLSVSGPITNTYKATSETQICVFCHTPHNANPAAPLWNHTLSTQTYTPYSSNTLVTAAPGQPSGTSKLCLSCHDGTVALGGVQNLPFGHQTAGTITGLDLLLGSSANLGTDLRNDHPVSFNYDAALAVANPELVSPASLTGKIKPDSDGQLQCSSCHDPHSETNPKFLHVGYTDGGGYGSPLCLTCHNKRYWGTLDRVANATHREAIIQWNGVGINPWHVAGHNLANDANSTNKANGCESCHQPHNAATSGSRILKQDGEAGVCLVCHNGNVVTDPAKNIDAAMNKTYRHPSKEVSYDGRHSPKRMSDGKVREEPANLGTNRHAECEDCHNPHAVSPGVSPAPNSAVPNSTNNLAAPVNKGVWGVQPTWPAAWTAVTSYNVVDDVQYQHELCFKCHSYYAFGASPPPDPYSHITGGINTDQAKEFNPNNPSYHPVVAAGKNSFSNASSGNYAASLINGMTPTSVFTCSECHSDSDPAAGGLKGPHGSDVWPIIWGPYDYTTGISTSSNHLCFKCHDYNVYAGSDYTTTVNKTGFRGTVGGSNKNLHARHVGMRDMPCMACHTAVPHGSSNRALLIYGRGANKAPAPYNSHVQFPICHNATYTTNNACADYGINSDVTNVNTVTSGAWQKTTCHSGSGTGSCATASSYP